MKELKFAIDMTRILVLIEARVSMQWYRRSKDKNSNEKKSHVLVHPTIPALRRLKQEDPKFKASLGYIVWSCHKNINKWNKYKVMLLKNSSVVLQNVKYRVAIWTIISTSRYIPERNEYLYPCKTLYRNVHSITVHNNQKYFSQLVTG
jgi:hypothetical protein